MIVTVTPNPSFDRTIAVDALVRGEVHRATSSTVEAAGKGINVSRGLVSHGHSTIAVVPSGRGNDGVFAQMLADDGVPHHIVGVGGPVRTNIGVVERDGTTTKFNESGSPFEPDEAAQLIRAAAALAGQDHVVVGCGSLPPGMPSDFYACLAAALPDPTSTLMVDTSGAALAQMATTACALIKPNLEELEQLVGTRLATMGQMVDAALSLIETGPRRVLVSLGALGAVLVTADRAWFGSAPTDAVLNTVGAGDSMLAGFVSVGSFDDRALAASLAWGRAAVRSATTRMATVTSADHDAVVLTSSIDRSQPTGDA